MTRSKKFRKHRETSDWNGTFGTRMKFGGNYKKEKRKKERVVIIFEAREEEDYCIWSKATERNGCLARELFSTRASKVGGKVGGFVALPASF